MCGIAGIINYKGIQNFDIELIKKMNFIQNHRGPDDEGIYSDKFCTLGHRRLSIIDLSQNGHQPFFSDNKRYVLTYNGEIYNYIELRQELEHLGWKFLTKTDTEVLIKAYQQFGKDCLKKLNGMFAFAIYDSQQNNVFLARDRVGIKPLYYTIYQSALYFASEIKAIRNVPNIDLAINKQSVFDYLVFNRTDIYDETFLFNIKRVPKGHYATFSKTDFTIEKWWEPHKYIIKTREDSFETIIETIENILVDATKIRMRSDVRVGSCLSGGLDSSILVGILFDQNYAKKDYPTFTASFPGLAIDETAYIDQLNKRFNFKNYRAFPTAENAYKSLKDFIYQNDEPTTGPSFFSQYEVMKLAKKEVTVLIDGQGGDENFAGYQYFHGFYLSALLYERKIVNFMSELFKTILRAQSLLSYQTLLFQIFPPFCKKFALLSTLPFMQKDFFDYHIQRSKIFNEFFDAPTLNTSLVRHFQYKLEHLLRMEDRNSMAFSLETRLPYLDYRLIEYVLSISGDLKIKFGSTKYLQKKAVGQYTIPEIVNRKDKIGFGTPGQQWLNEPYWKRTTEKSSLYCEEKFSDIFKHNFLKVLPDNAFNHWKINQLALWHQMVS